MEVKFEAVNRELIIAKSDRMSLSLPPIFSNSTDHPMQSISSTRISWISSARFANRSMRIRFSWKRKFKDYKSRSATSRIRTGCNLNKSTAFYLRRFPCNPTDSASVSGCWSGSGNSRISEQALLERIYQRRSGPGCWDFTRKISSSKSKSRRPTRN